jgi:putative CocE/NonD family hydrolase
MRDGVRLATTVYRPRGEGPWPTVLIRNPYDAGFFMRAWCEIFVGYGYACVFQEARGQMESEGDWNPLVHEVDDGEDTLAWLIAQDFQDGNIGFYGPSYLGAVQWAMAARGLPPEVKTMIPIVTGTDFARLAYQRGMFRHEVLTAWSATMPGRGFNTENGARYGDAVRHRPHVEVDELYFGARLDWYREWVTSPDPDFAIWQREDFAELMAAPAKLEIPILSIGGWYDIFFDAQLRDWRNLATRDRSRFIIGPWTHIMQPGASSSCPTRAVAATSGNWCSTGWATI